MEKLVLVILLLLSMTLTATATASTKVIYGDDNRVDVYESNNSDFVELSKSTAAQISKSNLKKSWMSNVYTIKAKSLSERGMCKTERFANQPTAARCSGFLVSDKYIVTAGHCVQTQSDCNDNYWVFNYKMKNSTEAPKEVAEENIFKCKKIISQVLSRSSMDDYALIELDRPATNFTPLTLRKSGKPAVGDKLVVIGHPTGLPTKISDGAEVRSLKGKYFTANLDTYGGNSGSAVFNVTTGEVEGILVRGDTDYVRDGGCQVSNRVGNDSGRGEDVTFITNIAELQNL